LEKARKRSNFLGLSGSGRGILFHLSEKRQDRDGAPKKGQTYHLLMRKKEAEGIAQSIPEPVGGRRVFPNKWDALWVGGKGKTWEDLLRRVMLL